MTVEARRTVSEPGPDTLRQPQRGSRLWGIGATFLAMSALMGLYSSHKLLQWRGSQDSQLPLPPRSPIFVPESTTKQIPWIKFVPELPAAATGSDQQAGTRFNHRCAELGSRWRVCSQQQLGTGWVSGYEECRRGVVMDPQRSHGLSSAFFSMIANHGGCGANRLTGTAVQPLGPVGEWPKRMGLFCCEAAETKLGCEGSRGGQSEELTLMLFQSLISVFEEHKLRFWVRGSSALAVVRENSLTPNCVEIRDPDDHSTPDVDIAVADLNLWTRQMSLLEASIAAKGFYISRAGGSRGTLFSHVWYPVSRRCREYILEVQRGEHGTVAPHLTDWGDWNVCFHVHLHHPADGYSQTHDQLGPAVDCHYSDIRHHSLQVNPLA